METLVKGWWAMRETYAEQLSVCLHGTLLNIAEKLGRVREGDSTATLDDLREILLTLADNLPAPGSAEDRLIDAMADADEEAAGNGNPKSRGLPNRRRRKRSASNGRKSTK